MKKTYYRNNYIVNLLMAGFVILFAALLFKVLPISALIFFFLGILLGYSAIQIRLVISPEGIEYHQVGYSICSTWNNVAQIGNMPAGRLTVEGLILHEPALYVGIWLSKVNYIQTRGRLIPLSLFKHNWLDNEIGQDIKQYAPHLFIHK